MWDYKDPNKGMADDQNPDRYAQGPTKGEVNWLESEERIVNDAVLSSFLKTTTGLKHDYRRRLLESAIVLLQSQRVNFPFAS